MKVLYFYQHFSTPKGSTGIRAYEFARTLVKKGHRVTMVCGACATADTGLTDSYINCVRRGTIDGIDVIEFNLNYSNNDNYLKRTLTFLKFAFKSISIALFHDYDMLFATTTPLTAGIPGIFAKLLRKKPFVFEVRDLWPELPKAMGVITNPIILSLLSWLEWCSYHSADACIGLAPGIVEGIIKRGVSPGNVVLLPNGCDLSIFGNSKTNGWRPESVHSDDFMAVFTGAHGVANGLNAVLDAAKVLTNDNRTNIKFVFIGEGSLKGELKKRAAKEGLSNCIFLDAVPKDKLAGLLSEADIGLMILANVPAFYYGTSPNKFFDYIAAGLPVLNNYPGWLADIIEKFRCGLAVPPDDPRAFADALVSVADNPEIIDEMGRNARKLASEQFNRLDIADKFVTFLESVLAKHREKYHER
ncbi:MAG: glycosyltransferase WbuB [wastewater metagenome]|nr:glycosyltransferase WbuB [Candidatus Loosdrechtia aerotolerans]